MESATGSLSSQWRFETDEEKPGGSTKALRNPLLSSYHWDGEYESPRQKSATIKLFNALLDRCNAFSVSDAGIE